MATLVVSRISLLIVLGVFLVRLPGVVEPMGPDQGVYTTIGWAMQNGLTLYRDLFEQKPPAIYVTYAAGLALFGERATTFFWIDYLAGALTALVLFDLGRRAVSSRFGALAAAVFAVGTLPALRYSLGGFVERAITEPFVCLFIAAAAWATVAARDDTGARDRWALVAGLFLGTAAAYKPTAAVYWLAFAVWIWFAGADRARAFRFAVVSMIGGAVVPLAAVTWMWAGDMLRDAWIALSEYNRAYLAVGDHSLASIATQFAREVYRRMRSDDVWALGSLSAAIALLSWRWRASRPGLAASLAIFWLGASLLATVANGPRLFTTYFVPPRVPLCLLVAWLLDQTLGSRVRWRVAAGVAVLVLSGVMIVRAGSWDRAVTMTASDARYLFGRIDRDEYLQTFSSRDGRAFSAADNARLADYVRAHTEPADRIFVFGMTAGTYFSSGRLPASRFLFVYPAVSNMIDRPEFTVDALASELRRTRPRYIILQRYNRDSFSGWRVEDSFAAPPIAALLADYQEETEVGNFVLFRLR